MTHRRAGYSLFEVLIAFVIMTSVLAVLLPGQSRLLGRAEALQQQQLAFDFALSRLAALQVAQDLPLGRSQDTYQAWVIQTDIRPGAMLPSGRDTVHVEVRIRDRRGRQLALAESLLAIR